MWAFVAIAAVAGVVVGALVENRSDLLASTHSVEAAQRATVAAGAIKAGLQEPPDEWDFGLPVHNASDAPVDADLISLDGVSGPLTSRAARNIAPRSWGTVEFSVATNCDAALVESIASVRLRIGAPGGSADRTVALPGAGNVFVDYHRDLCRPGKPVKPAELHGVWMVDEVYGEDTGLVGIMLWRFGRDGSFTADPQGGLFSPNIALRGTYRLRDQLLTINVEGGYGCGASGPITWRVALDGYNRMTMAWIRGTCPSGEPGHLWVMQRVLRDVGLPRVD